MEDDISDAIYGDLGDFEYNEKLKEQCEEITSLKERLNQSLVSITDLERKLKDLTKTKQDLEMKISSLILTAKVELDRKQRQIVTLQQRIDNQIFRRPNNYRNTIQHDANIGNDPVLQQKNVIGENIPEQIEHQPAIVDKRVQNFGEKSDNFRNEQKKFRIPKKTQSSTNEHTNEPSNQVNVLNGNETETRNHQPPKRSSHTRCVDGEEVKSNGRKDIDEEKSRTNRRNGDARRHSPVSHSTNRQWDYRNNGNKWDNRRHHRKHSRSRSPSDDIHRHSKRHRSDSTSNRQRSRSRPFQNEDRHQNRKDRRRSHSKTDKHHRIDDKKSETWFPDMGENDLEALLIAQQKVLNDIDRRREEKRAPEERRKRKASETGPPEKSTKTNDRDVNRTNNVQVETDGKSIQTHRNDSKKMEKSPEKEDLMLRSNETVRHTNESTDDRATRTSSEEVPLIESLQPGIDVEQSEEPIERTNIMVSTEIEELRPTVSTNFNQDLPLIESVEDPVQPIPSKAGSDQIVSQTNDSRRSVETKAVDCSENLSTEDTVEPVVASCESSDIKRDEPAQNPNDLRNFGEVFQANRLDEGRQNGKVSPVATSTPNEELSLVEEDPTPENDRKPFSSLMKFFSPPKGPAESTRIEPVEVPKTNRFHDENSNSQMDIDYELMVRTSLQNHSKSSNRRENSPKTIDAPQNVVPEATAMQVDASFVAVDCSAAETSRNSSNERHTLLNGTEYTVEEDAIEIRIFLTKKRKKSKKNAKGSS